MLLKMCSGKEILVLQHRSPVNIFVVLYCLHSVIGKMANLLHFLLMETGKNTAQFGLRPAGIEPRTITACDLTYRSWKAWIKIELFPFCWLVYLGEPRSLIGLCLLYCCTIPVARYGHTGTVLYSVRYTLLLTTSVSFETSIGYACCKIRMDPISPIRIRTLKTRIRPFFALIYSKITKETIYLLSFLTD